LPKYIFVLKGQVISTNGNALGKNCSFFQQAESSAQHNLPLQGDFENQFLTQGDASLAIGLN
jgi:hypothetical protein